MDNISEKEKKDTAVGIEVKLTDKARKVKRNPENYNLSDLRDICQLNQIRDNLKENYEKNINPS